MKRFAIIEAGGTKTDVVVCSAHQILYQQQFSGLNPKTSTTEHLSKTISDIEVQLSTFQPLDAYYYGAGCSSPESNKIISRLFSLPIVVEHDLLATARGLLQNQSGIAIILGTGSNSCCYDGENIVANTPSLGYILGDEGGGVHLGKLLVRDYIHQTMPTAISMYITENFEVNQDTLIDKLYRHSNPNAYLAQFAKVLSENKDQEYAVQLVQHSFTEFIVRYLLPYQSNFSLANHSVWASGSVAMIWEDILERTLMHHNFELKKVVKSPLDGLINYHRNSYERENN